MLPTRPSRLLALVLVAAAAVGLAGAAAAQAPANDDCATATFLPTSPAAGPFITASSTNVGATDSTPPEPAPTCTPVGTEYEGGDIWFQSVIPASGALTLAEQGDSPWSTEQSAAYIGTCGGGLTQIACSGSALSSTITLPVSCLPPGTTVYWRLWDWGNDNFGNITVYAFDPVTGAPPANDCCANATPLPVGAPGSCPGASTMFTMNGATDDGGVACDTSVNYGVWFSFVAPPSGRVEVIASSALEVALFDSCGGTELGCDTTAASAVFACLTPGATYRLLAFEDSTTFLASYSICVQEVVSGFPANDCCSNPTPVPVNMPGACNAASTTFSMIGVTEDGPLGSASCDATTNFGVWFSFTATSDVVEIFTNSVREVAVFEACGGAEVGCDTTGVDSAFPVVPGNSYLAFVYEDAAVTTNPTGGDFICIEQGPPAAPNDQCANAILIPVAPNEAACVSTFVDTTNAFQSLPTPSCATTATDDDVWYQFIAPTTGNVQIRADSFTGTATFGAAIYDACGGNEVYCDAGSTGTTVDYVDPTTGLTPGATYWLRVWNTSTTVGGTFNLCVFRLPGSLACDECAGAIPIPVSPFAGPFVTSSCDNSLATDSTPPEPLPTCVPAGTEYEGGDIWFSSVVPASGSLSLAEMGDSPWSTEQSAAYVGTCGGGLTQIACSGSALSNTITLDVTGQTPGTTVYWRLWDWGNDNFGVINLYVFEPPPPPPNDECANAIPVPVAPNQAACTITPVNTVSATQSLPAPSCATTATDDDVWYSFVAPPTGRVFVQGDNFTGTAAFGAAVYTACGGTQVFCDAGSLGTPDVVDMVTGLTPGATYLLRLWNTSTTAGGTWDLCVWEPEPPPVNDGICGALPINCGDTVFGNTMFASPDSAPTCGTTDGTGGAVWYQWQAGSVAECVTITTCNPGTTFDTKLRVYTTAGDTCFEAVVDSDNLQCVAGNDDSCTTTALRSTVTFTALPFKTHWILVHGFSANAGQFELSMQCTPPPVNDDACGAALALVGAATPYDNNCAGPSGISPGVGTGTNSCDSTDGWCASDPNAQKDIWFRFFMPASGSVTIGTDQATGSADTQLAVWTTPDCTDPSQFVEVVANDDGGAGTDALVTVNCGVPGQVYYVQLDWFSTTTPANSTGDLIITDNGGLLPAVDITFDCATYVHTGVPGFDEPIHLNALGFGGPFGFGQDLVYTWAPNTGIVASNCEGSTISVAPDDTTVYTVTVTDSRGCTATDTVTVNVFDAAAACGDVFDPKVQICHVPPGNWDDRHPICIAVSALPAHLPGDVGHDTCFLGPCDGCFNQGIPPVPNPTSCTPEAIDDFDPTLDAPRWSSLVSATASPLCGAESSPNSLLFDGPNPRSATTSPLVFGPNSAVQFDVMHPTALVTPCEAPDVAADNLLVEWSLDGVNWTSLGEVAFNTAPTWTSRCFALPAESVCGDGTYIRFRQEGTATTFEEDTLNSFDQWMIDDFEIICLPEPPPPPPCAAVAVDDFDPAIDATKWTSIQNGTAGTGCGNAAPASGNTLHFNGTGPRLAEAVPHDLGPGSAIQFALRVSNTTGAGCEDLDAASEAVELQVASAGGSCVPAGGWVTIATYGPDFGAGAWTTVTESIPTNLQGTAVAFRFIQDTHSGNDFDNWAIDNVQIVCGP